MGLSSLKGGVMATLASFYGGTHKGSVFGKSAEYGSAFHYGQDIKGHPEGTPIPAVSGGTVARAGWQVGHGWWLAVDTGDGWFDTYSHMVGLWHDVGAVLNRADHVGPLGTTGQSTGPHLHFQHTRDPFPWAHGTEVDPWPYIVNAFTSTAGDITPFVPAPKGHAMKGIWAVDPNTGEGRAFIVGEFSATEYDSATFQIVASDYPARKIGWWELWREVAEAKERGRKFLTGVTGPKVDYTAEQIAAGVADELAKRLTE